MLITMFWGATFLAVQYAVTMSGPLFFVGLRFATAAVAVAIVSFRCLRGITWLEIKAGVVVGIAIACGYSLQTWGLTSISSSKSAFISAMYVPLVPLLQWICLGRMPGLMSWIGVALAFCGLVLLAGPEGGLGVGLGEAITLASAVAIAAEIILIGAWAGKVDIRRVTVVQLATASVLAFAATIPAGETIPGELPPGLIAVAAGLGIFSAIIQVTMNWAQRSVSPTRATVIYTGEPVWAGIFGRFAGEQLPVLAIGGAALIILGVMVSELKLKKRQPLPVVAPEP
ncbi:DMT family transporter [Shimwellia blattae]|uniref:Putative transmembrane protein n=1 Tax=Shimwellia blattae (strain ATCC 29907 / DSM 4481 / JCM 1650 / NBRC 105725 / CDC 9005-74) TaxID=630626 RepID=I2BAI6_SHIBC|nr:DMT family transporter [Shimwellia blattae]AFJ47540.1 putative transmembrane protein [Shimwellia blattae DSM 4481 = NBRC 105725]VDY65038.1 putative DMT superfamily transporter inner membrane protein [Shimwellia blattae]VEC23396.1 putative DMT superfamily transporter inner membrane protein [Shimwellia blattae]